MSRDRREPSPDDLEEGTEGRKIFVGGLSVEVTESDLYKAFEKYGVVRAQIQYDAYSQRSRGFGFVIFGDEKSCRRAIAEMEGAEVRGKRVSVKLAIPPENIRPPRRPFRGGRGPPRGRGYGGRGDYRYEPRYSRPPPRYQDYERGYPSRYDRYQPGLEEPYYEPYDRYEPAYRGGPSGYDERYRGGSGGPDRSYRERGYSTRAGPYERSRR